MISNANIQTLTRTAGKLGGARKSPFAHSCSNDLARGETIPKLSISACFAGAFRRDSKVNAKGFTLLEIMIVIAIIAAVVAIGAPRMLNTSSDYRAAVRKLAVSSREIRNNSRLFNLTTRLAITMNEKEGHSYTVESASGNVPLLSEEQQEELDRLTSAQREDEQPASKFAQETRVLRKPVGLPRGLFIEGVEYANRQDAITEGTAYVHFFPSGLAEEAVIHLTNRQTLNWTIAINPLTGRADVYERKISLKELRAQ